MSPSIYLSSTFFLFGTTKCSRLIFYFTCLSFSLRYFSKEPWFLLLENCFKKPNGPWGFNFLIGQTKKLRCKCGNKLPRIWHWVGWQAQIRIWVWLLVQKFFLYDSFCCVSRLSQLAWWILFCASCSVRHKIVNKCMNQLSASHLSSLIFHCPGQTFMNSCPGLLQSPLKWKNFSLL